MAGKAGSPAPKNPPNDHNEPKPLTDAEKADLFLVHLAQGRKDNDALETAMEAVRAVRKARTRNRTLARTDGFPLTELDIILADELLARHEVEDREAKRGMMRQTAGLPGGALVQADLFDDSFTQADKDRAYWQADGYAAGLRGLDPKHPDEMPTEFGNDRLESYHDGQKVLAKAFETKAAIDARTQPAP